MARIKLPSTGRKARVLVIDDDLDLLKSMIELFERDGHGVRGSHDPAGGVELVREWQPELLLLDYRMPGMNGPEVVRAIREFDKLDAGMLLVTGYAG